MTYQAEVAKEYLRDAFHKGALDITGSYEQVRGFVQIFAGEMDAVIAINQCRFLTPAQARQLMAEARPTREAMEHYHAWLARVLS